MTDPGLNDRLRQKSRRSGLAVGLSMALAIAICIGGATLIYAALIEPLSDLIPIDGVSSGSNARAVQTMEPATTRTEGLAAPAPIQIMEPNQGGSGQTAGSPPQEPEGDAAEPPVTSTPESDLFEPTHQIGASQSVNFRAGPTRGDAIIIALPPSTALRYLDEQAPTEDPSDGNRWMRFETEDGQEGWIREIDVVTYRP
jgi:hypothetical protein